MRDALEGWIVTTGRLVKQDEVGRFVGALFQRIRDEVQRQIQMHMAVVANAQTTGELQALTLDSLKRMEQNGATKLLRLSGSGSGVASSPPLAPEPSQPSAGSGSGSVPSMQMPPHRASMPMPPQSVSPRQGMSGARVALLIVGIVFGLGVLLGLAIVLRPRARPSPTPVAINDSTNLGIPPPAPSAPPPMPVSAQPATPDTAPAPPPPSDTPASPRKPTQHAPTHNRPQPGPPTPPSGTVQPAQDDPGYLTLQTYPFTRVSEGGRSLGTTPLVKMPLLPGPHSLTLENSEQGIKQTYTVNIKSGETVTRNLGLK
jgi:serine/threonine-protein kinase